MPITCEDLRSYAAELAGSATAESHRRCSISRAYYAAFHAALPLANVLPPSAGARPGDRHITHHELSCRLREWRVGGIHPRLNLMRRTSSVVARAIASSRAARVKADYDLGDEVLASEVSSQLERTNQIMKALAQIENEMERLSKSKATASA